MGKIVITQAPPIGKQHGITEGRIFDTIEVKDSDGDVREGTWIMGDAGEPVRLWSFEFSTKGWVDVEAGSIVGDAPITPLVGPSATEQAQADPSIPTAAPAPEDWPEGAKQEHFDVMQAFAGSALMTSEASLYTMRHLREKFPELELREAVAIFKFWSEKQRTPPAVQE